MSSPQSIAPESSPRALVAVAVASPAFVASDPVTGSSLDLAVLAWLDAKSQRTGSAKTRRAYQDGISVFRARLVAAGLDLDGDPRAVALVAQGYAGQRRPDGRAVAPATYNQRLAILGSFYTYATKRGFLAANPITLVERRPSETYATARALDPVTVAAQLAAIDRRTSAGARDYALLAVALATGRRLSELAGLRMRHLAFSSTRAGRVPSVLITWPRAKGDKHLADELRGAPAAALLAWLGLAYGTSPVADGEVDPQAPIWISLARNGSGGRALSLSGIARICEARLGTAKVHTLRHTFAHGMEQVGAKVSDIQARLGHSSLATTGRYLAALSRAENAHADALSALFGLTGETRTAHRQVSRGARR